MKGQQGSTVLIAQGPVAPRVELMNFAVPDLPPRLSRRLLRDLQDHARAFMQDVDLLDVTPHGTH